MEKQLAVALNASVLPPSVNMAGSCAVVIDVLRATSVMTVAGANGASEITTCGEVDEARKTAAAFDPPALLCGERQCQIIEGFDFGNSPAEYTPDRVSGKSLVLTTTNGTRAIQAAKTARRLVVASFLNLGAVLTAIRKERDIHLICAGTNGDVTLEDVLLAGAIAHRCCEESPCRLDDSAQLAVAAWNQVLAESKRSSLEAALIVALNQSLGGRNLIELGYDLDVRRCARLDSVEGYMERVASDNRFTYRKSSGDSGLT